MTSPLYCVLLHHPVKARDGRTVTTAVTNLDVHDIARTARAYDAKGYFVVTPIEAQRTLVERILSHWRDGAGAKRVPERTEALRTTRVVDSLDAAIAAVREAHDGEEPRLVCTGARAPEGKPTVSYAEESSWLRQTSVPTMILFGTGHGIAAEVVERSDAVLAPVRAGASYNHLSVRAAVAIVFDRLVGEG